MVKRILAIAGVVLAASMLIAMPVFAISNPDTIEFGSGTSATNRYQVFANVLETGDFLFAAEGLVSYNTTPTDYTASQAFLFEVLNTAANVTLFAIPLTSYGDRPIGIYITAAQAVTANITFGTAYVVRITGNPLVFASPTGNTVSKTLANSDYNNETTSGATPASRGYLDPLRLWCLNVVAADMQTYDINITHIITSATPYYVYVQGYNYLTTLGGNLFISGINNLNNMCPLLFQSSIQQLTAPAPTGTGAYAATLNPLGQMGGTIAGGLTSIGKWIGVGGDNGGAVVLLIISIIVCAFVYKKTQSGIVVLLLGIATPIAGVFLGLMSMAIMFIVVIFVVIIMLYYFFSRGIL